MSVGEDLTGQVEQTPHATVAIDGGRPEKKPDRTKTPKPTVGYIAVRHGWDPRDSHDRISLWNPHASQAAAEAERAHANSLGCEPRRIVRVDTAFTIVDDGGTEGGGRS